MAIAGTTWLISKMYEDLAPYRLTTIRSPRAAFITADSPVSLFPESVDERDEAVFLPDTEFVLPLTPSHAVLITARLTLSQKLDADPSVEAIINARTARAAFRDIYCAPGYAVDALSQHLDGWWASMPLLRLLS